MPYEKHTILSRIVFLRNLFKWGSVATTWEAKLLIIGAMFPRLTLFVYGVFCRDDDC